MTPSKSAPVIPAIEDGEHLAYLLDRALEQVAGELGPKVLVKALARAGRELPTSRVSFLAFVSGALYDVVEAEIDADAADLVTSLVCEKIDRWVRHNRSSDRSETEPPRGESKTVLVVDDDPLVTKALKRLLKSVGYEALTAEDGEQALEICVNQRPAVVVTDFDMPLVSGKQLASLIRITLGDDAPPILLLTGSDSAPSTHADFVSVLMKPVDGATLFTAIGDALLRRQIKPDTP
ncbi:MAG: response regulator [Deltaproteobacteria bacterium]|nr:response regulator [Deltaproteobacteria bacterium]